MDIDREKVADYNSRNIGGRAMLNETVKAQLQQAATGVRQTLDESVAELRGDPKMVKIFETQKALNNLEEMLGQPKTSLAEVFGLEAPAADKVETSTQ